MIPDGPNTLTCQSASTNDAPRDPLHGPVTWNPALSRICGLQLLLRLRHFNIQQLLNCHEDDHFPHQLSDASAGIGIASFALVAVYDLIKLTVFYWV